MDKQIQKLKQYLESYLSFSHKQIRLQFGAPDKAISDNDIWFYRTRRWLILEDEICFFFKAEMVTDIVITQYFLGKPMYNIMHKKGQVPEYIKSPVSFIK